jgi:HEAT repeat protein
LEDPDGYVRNGAAIALGKIGNRDATQPLIRALQWRDDRVYEDDEDQEARISAATALGKLRSDVACKALMAELEKLPSMSSTLASYMVEALGEIGDPKAVPVMVSAIDSGDFELQKIASWALAKLGGDGIGVLLRMAANRDQLGRAYVIRALGMNSVESAIPLLLQIVETPNEDKFARCQAAEALGRIGASSKTLPVLLAMLQAPEEEVRNGALYGLGALHDSRAYSAIVEQLDSLRKGS